MTLDAGTPTGAGTASSPVHSDPSGFPALFDQPLEVRQRGDREVLSGSFPYGRTATRADRGRVRKELFRPGALNWRLQQWEALQEEMAEALQSAIDRARIEALEDAIERGNIHILSGHRFDKPLGDLKAGTARIWDDRAGVHFEVDLPAEVDRPSWVDDTVRGIRSGLTTGVSPGYRIPPRSAVAEPVRLVPEPGNPDVMIREIRQANLYELAVVTRPHYAGTSAEIDTREYREPHRRRWWR